MITVTLKSLEFANPAQEALVRQACEALQTAINHPRFVERLRSAKYKQARLKTAAGKTVHVKAEEVIGYIASGQEMGTAADQEIDLAIQLKPLKNGTVGSTTLGKLPFRTAYWFIDGCVEKNDVVSPARHFIHEWLHVVGFYHWPNNSAREDVPYVVGDIVRQVLTKDIGSFIGQESPAMARLLDEADEEVLEDEPSAV